MSKTTIVNGIGHFYKLMDGIDCPKCKQPSRWISTINQWQYYCKDCNFRFNFQGQPPPTS